MRGRDASTPHVGAVLGTSCGTWVLCVHLSLVELFEALSRFELQVPPDRGLAGAGSC